jgi:hypothetical protein
MAHRADYGKTVACSWHVQIRKQNIECFSVDEMNSLGDVGGGRYEKLVVLLT